MILHDPDPAPAGGGGGAPPAAPPANTPPANTPPARWDAALPPEYRDNPSVKNCPDVQTLVKNYINAERMIGAKRFAIPSKDAPGAEWDAIYNAIGRPETVDKYSTPTVKPADGLVIGEPELQTARKKFHELGITDRQYQGIMDFYFTGINDTHGKMSAATKASMAQSNEALRKDWGDKFDANLDVAKSALRHFGGEDVFAELDAGLGNNVGLIKMLHKVGATMMEDRTRGGGAGLQVTATTQAASEIEQLKVDATFQKVLNDPVAVGHRQSVDRWLDLHRKAHPGKAE